MTTFKTATKATATISYHTSQGLAHIIHRPTLSLGNVVDGKIVSLLTNFDKPNKAKYSCFYLALFKPAKKATKVYVVLGCGSIVRFDYDAFEYLEDGRSKVDVDQLELVDKLPVEVADPALDLPAFVCSLVYGS